MLLLGAIGALSVVAPIRQLDDVTVHNRCTPPLGAATSSAAVHPRPLYLARAPGRCSQNLLMMNKRSKNAGRRATAYIELKDDGSDMWRAQEALTTLKAGGCGVIPTDTSYSFVTPISSKAGAQRILEFKGTGSEKKPLSILCRSLGDIEHYTKGMTREGFKMLRAHLPGAFTFIMPASQHLPKGLYKDGKRAWKRDSVGVRIPDDPVCAAVLAELDEPLLCSSVPTTEDGDQLVCNRLPLDGDGSASWCDRVDFVLDAGQRPSDGSSVYDLTGDEGDIVLVREGLGQLVGY